MSSPDSGSAGRCALPETARIAARDGAGARDEDVLVLLREREGGVARAMAAALLQARRERAIPLLLRRLGESRADGQWLLEGLLESELDGIDVRGAIVSALLAASEPDVIAGALGAIAWLAPGGGFPGSPASRARVRALGESDDGPVRVLARAALIALTER